MKSIYILNFKFFTHLSLTIFLVLIHIACSAQLFYVNGIEVTNDAYIRVLGSVSNNNTGVIDNQGVFVIDSNIINNSLVKGSGSYHVSGNWENNNTFYSETSKVILEGGNQLITGTEVSSYYDLELTGSGVKTQTINSFVSDSLILNDIELATDHNTMFVTNTNTGAISRTTGFVSSLGDGSLSRATNTNSIYLFPVGSSLITTRYRPVEINPTTTSSNTYTVRFANNDASDDNYNRDLNEIGVCSLNPLYYHRINRTNGSAPADISIFYNEADDGFWGSIANWNTSPSIQWEDIGPIVETSGIPLNDLTRVAWDNFNTDPYILVGISPIADSFDDQVACESYTLPEITGSNLSGNQNYYSLPNGQGEIISSPVTETQTVYIYDTDGTCSSEQSFNIEIKHMSIDDIPDLTTCDSYMLPIITGTGLSGNQNYYTLPNGQGEIVSSPITENQTIYIFDTDGICSAEQSFTVEIANPIIDIQANQLICIGNSTSKYNNIHIYCRRWMWFYSK